MIALAPWQTLLNSLGWVVAQIYSVIPNYGVTIIVLTLLIRLVLFPLGVRQIRSMQHMQIIQPKVKAIQQKFKGNKQRQQEEIMKLYKEYGVNPFSGCWPVLLQFPILIAMYSVVRFPQHPIHIPEGTELYAAVTAQIPITTPPPDDTPITTQAQIDAYEPPLPGPVGGTSFLGMNLLCSAMNAGKPDATLSDKSVNLTYPVNCGKAINRIPYYVFAVLMFGTTFFQQRQMQKASPPGASSSQQQALLKVMPIMFGVFGIFFPAGLVVYWTTSNAWQIGQQYYMLRTRPTAEALAAAADGKRGDGAPKKGFISAMMERAQQERQRRDGERKPGTPKPGTPKPGTPKPGTPSPGRRSPGRARARTSPRSPAPEAPVEEIQRSAPSVEEAVEAALAELGVSEQEVDVTVLQEPRQGLLGIGAQPAEVIVRVRRSAPDVSDEDLEEQGEIAAEFLEGLLTRMGVSAEVEPAFDGGTMYVDVLGEGPDDEDMGLLIGRHGQTLEALQELTRVVVGQRTGMRARVVVDVEDYRRRQRARLEARARELAKRVAKSGREEELEPMSAFDRKVVHDAVSTVSGVQSSSRGEEPERRVVISPS